MQKQCLLLGLFSTFFLLPLAAQSDLCKMNIKGNVKLYKEVSYTDSCRLKEDICDLYIAFDENGNRIVEADYENGHVKGSSAFVYDTNGRVIAANEFHDDGTLYAISTFKYGNTGLLMEKKAEYLGETHYLRHTYSYDKNDLLKEIVDFDENNNLFKAITFSYDNRGKITEERFYLPFGRLYSWKIFIYNNQGQLIEEQHYDARGFLYHSDLFFYDAHGNVKELQMRQFNAGLSDRNTYHYEYEYDQLGNWLCKKIYYNNKPLSVVERELEFF